MFQWYVPVTCSWERVAHLALVRAQLSSLRVTFVFHVPATWKAHLLASASGWLSRQRRRTAILAATPCICRSSVRVCFVRAVASGESESRRLHTIIKSLHINITYPRTKPLLQTHHFHPAWRALRQRAALAGRPPRANGPCMSTQTPTMTSRLAMMAKPTTRPTHCTPPPQHRHEHRREHQHKDQRPRSARYCARHNAHRPGARLRLQGPRHRPVSSVMRASLAPPPPRSSRPASTQDQAMGRSRNGRRSRWPSCATYSSSHRSPWTAIMLHGCSRLREPVAHLPSRPSRLTTLRRPSRTHYTHITCWSFFAYEKTDT